jgi:hypothetical protein
MTFRRSDPPLFTEIFGPLIGLKEEWEAQGATPDELSFSAFRYRAPAIHRIQVATGFFGGTPPEVLEETDTVRITRDGMGRTMRLQKRVATLALPMDYPVKTPDDWQRLKPHYIYSAERFQPGWEQAAREALATGAVLSLSMPGGFDEPRQLMGEENLCYALYDEPEMVADMLATIGDTVLRIAEEVTRQISVHQLSVHEDMAGKSGPLMSPDHIRQFVAPYYRRVWERMEGRGARLFDQDSDGDMRAVIPAFLEAGINCMHPMEPASNMDVVAIREAYGKRLAFYGGLDKHVLRKTKAEIDAELERKLPALLPGGGCMLALDHRIPNGTPLENYRHYIHKVWSLLGSSTLSQ